MNIENANPELEITEIVKKLALMILGDSRKSSSGKQRSFVAVDGSTTRTRELGEELEEWEKN